MNVFRRQYPWLLCGWLLMQSAATSAPAALAVAGRANANVSMAASGPFVAAVWSASTAAGDTDIYAAVSRDAGATFSAPVRVNSTPGDARVNGEQPPRLALNAREGATPGIAVVWTSKGTAGTTLLSSRSDDGGRTFSRSTVVPGSDAPGNRGWEAVGVGPGGHVFAAWLDHRKLAPPQDMKMTAEHHHDAAAAGATAPPADGVAMAQLSQLFVSTLDGAIAPQGVTGGVCYCCKTAVVAGPGNSLYLAWRHVYAGNMRDIAFSASRDGGKTFAPPVRVSEDKWQLEGCPDDGPSMAVDAKGTAHIVWPTVVTENGAPVKTLFHAMSGDGRSFSPRVRIPTRGMANHPQLAIDSSGTLAVTWDESGTGARTLALATGRRDGSGRVTFVRSSSPQEVGTYPVIVSSGPGEWLRAWTAGPPTSSQVRIGTVQ
jgi:hypothetical protein